MNLFNKFFKKKAERIFLDYASATPVIPAVGQEMVKFFSREFYNPSAIYEEALKVRSTVDDYRTRVAKIVGSTAKEITFTSGGTESVNLAILGVVEEALNTTRRPHIIISAIEHPAVVKAAEEVVRRGGELSVVEVNEEGLVSVESIKNLVKKNTVLVSIALANSEIGTLQPIARIGRMLKEIRKERGGAYPLLHTDASSAASYVSVSLETLQCDLLTLDGAKIYGPKGVGILATRRGVKFHPIIFGGGQERGRRSGTTNPALIAGFSKALEIAQEEREKESARLECNHSTTSPPKPKEAIRRLTSSLLSAGRTT
jgi:cysteine desulfurase